MGIAERAAGHTGDRPAYENVVVSTSPRGAGSDHGDGPAGADDRLRLLVVVPFGPRFDNLHGGRVTAQLLRRLTARHRVALVCLRRPGQGSVDSDLAARCELVREVELSPPWLGHAWSHRIAVLTAPIVGRPTAVSACFSTELLRVTQRVAADWRPDLIQLEHDALAFCGPFLSKSAPRRILVSHDPGLLAARDLASVTTGRQRLAHRLETYVWRRYWRSTLSTLDAVVVFTDSDARAIREVVPDVRLETIPLGIDLPDRAPNALGSDGSVGFVGGYAHQPNADAAMRLISSIMPSVRERVLGTPLVLVGDRPTDAMRAAAGPFDELTGRVLSVEPHVDRVAIVALPIRIGGGMRVKLLEAMAAGKAIVASPVAAAGLRLTDGEQLVLADSDSAFAAAIVALLGDPERRAQLGGTARAWAEQNLCWASRVTEYERLYTTLLGGRGSPSSAAERPAASPSTG